MLRSFIPWMLVAGVWESGQFKVQEFCMWQIWSYFVVRVASTVSLNQDCPLPFLPKDSWRSFKEPNSRFSTSKEDHFDWTLPLGAGVISLVAHRSVEDHQTSALHQHRHLPLLCRWQPGQDQRLVAVTGPDRLGVVVTTLAGSTLQGHHLTCLQLYVFEFPRTHTCKWEVIWFYIREEDIKNVQINNFQWISVISYNTVKPAEMCYFQVFMWQNDIG